MKALQLDATLQHLMTLHGPDVEVWVLDADTGERVEFALVPAIATVPQSHGMTKAVVYVALTPASVPALQS